MEVYEIDFIQAGNKSSADAITLRYKINDNGKYKVMIIDCGTENAADSLVNHITNYYKETEVDYMLITHLDKDHIVGIKKIIEEKLLYIKTIYMHRPWNHVHNILKENDPQDKRKTTNSIKKEFEDAYKYGKEIEELAKHHNISIVEPFSDNNNKIGIFDVLSPSTKFYEDLLIESNKTTKFDQSKENFDNKLENIIYCTNSTVNIRKNEYTLITEENESYEDNLLDLYNEEMGTSVENETSVIIYTKLDGKGILFTGDAGIKALNEAYEKNNNISKDLRFIQIPHHGSRHNVNSEILNLIIGNINNNRTITAFISAGKNDQKHPKECVINAFIKRGCKVFSNENATICHSNHKLDRGWVNAKPLKFINYYKRNL